MNKSNSKSHQNYSDKKGNFPSEKQDFFSQLQETEKEKGKDARGKGHGWTTLAEILMGDW